MIHIYNEMATPWILGGKDTNKQDIGVIFRKTLKNIGTDTKIQKAYMLADKDYLDNSNTIECLNKSVNMKDCSEATVVIDKASALYFSKKDLSPFITNKSVVESNTSSLAHMFLASISIKGKKIIKIDNDCIFILKGYTMSGELTLVTSFTEKSGSLIIDMLEGKGVIRYIFRLVNGRIVKEIIPAISKEEYEKTNKVINIIDNFKVRKYVPLRKTHVIIVHEKDLEVAETLISREERTKHEIVVVNRATLDDAIEKLRAENYGAVTLFINSPYRTEETNKIYGNMSKRLDKSFRIIYNVFNTGKVARVKF